MLKRGIKDERIQPVLETFKRISIEVSRNPQVLGRLCS